VKLTKIDENIRIKTDREIDPKQTGVWKFRDNEGAVFGPYRGTFSSASRLAKRDYSNFKNTRFGEIFLIEDISYNKQPSEHIRSIIDIIQKYGS